MISTDMIIMNSTVTGTSHFLAQKECQDYSISISDKSTGLQVISVSDGHGGKEYVNSAKGAKIACTVAVESVMGFCEHFSKDRLPSEKDLRTLARCICCRWMDDIEQLSSSGTDAFVSYGCTLIVYAQTPDYWIALQIGDGRCFFDNNYWFQPIEWDERCILNLTTSMSDVDACDEFRLAFGKEIPQAVFICTDGIDGTFGCGKHIHAFFDNIIKSIKEDGIEKVSSQLPEVLEHYSSVGSHDDMSIAFILNDESMLPAF